MGLALTKAGGDGEIAGMWKTSNSGFGQGPQEPWKGLE